MVHLAIGRTILGSGFYRKNVKLLDWTAKSRDLNIIENACGLLARRVYGNRRQLDNLEDLAGKIIDCWVSIPPQYLPEQALRIHSA